MILRLLWQLYLLFQCTRVGAVASNRTIDDTFGDSVTGVKPIYIPEGTWDDANCSPSHCHIIPPPGQAFRNNYHAATYFVGTGPRTVQLLFKGTAIYVFFILANNVPDAGTETFCDFILDGSVAGSYHHAPTSDTNYEYNTLVFSKSGLRNTDHTLLISMDGYNTLSFVNFDYAIYTYDDGIAPIVTHSNPNTETTKEQPLTPAGPVANPHTVTTVISGTTVVTQAQSMPSQITSGSAPSSVTAQPPADATTPSGSFAGNVSRTAAPASSSSGGNGSIVSDSGSNTEAPKAPVGAIAGGAVGGVVVVLVVALLFFCLRRRRMQSETTLIEYAPTSGTSGYPLLTPFTPTSPRNNLDLLETRALDSTAFLVPNKKQRLDHMQENLQPDRFRNMHTPSTSMDSSSEALRVQRQSLIKYRIADLTKTFQSTGGGTNSSASGSSRMSEILEQNQAMKAEIERLQAQLNSDWALGLTNEPPPGYSRHGGGDNLLPASTPAGVT